ncbi:MAG TPA: HAD-IIIC family phosphatase [Polyangiaceae bacterium]|nr:HAD-IIIC family phosphatase [Polyangiaceae bacterium]
MKPADYLGLSWLPAPPADFAAACRSLGREASFGRRAQHLANHALDEDQLNRLSSALQRAAAAGGAVAPLVPLRLGVVGNATTHFLVPVLIATAARHGLALECVEADYGQVMQAALDPASSINRAGCDAVLLALDHRAYPLTAIPGDAASAEQALRASLEQLDGIRRGFSAHGNAVCIVQTLPQPVESLFGSFDLTLPGAPRRLVDELNRCLVERLAGTPDVLLDVAQLAASVGLSEWHSPKLWNLAKLPFNSRFLPLYAEHVCRLLGALRGRSKKCLVLDLDNTLWGGVIGDDGIDGIVLGQGDATGEAHLELQRAALELRRRGIVLAVSSKNTDAVAREPFTKHPDMLLKEEHIAVFQANWSDKATNLRAIAQELNLGLDALVFVDDNPVERQLVRELVPEVSVPELPDDPALYARTLLSAGYFEGLAFSEEDRQRAEQYRDNARRVALQKQAGDVDAYLASLGMRLTVQPFDDSGRQRIAQLINKSNQFNLTTRRYTEAEVAQIEQDSSAFALQLRLSDSFGDNGMISVVICRRSGDAWEIDTWLMSCRVLGRKVEQAVLAELAFHAREHGVRRLLGEYLPTEKNALVATHYERLGFSLLERLPTGQSRWQLDLEQLPSTAALPMAIERRGFSTEAAA